MSSTIDWSVISDWKNKNNELGYYGVKKDLCDNLKGSVEEDLIKISEGCNNGKEFLEDLSASFTAYAKEKDSSIQYVITYSILADVHYYYEVQADSTPTEDWDYGDYDDNVHYSIGEFTITTTYSDLQSERIRDINFARNKRYTVTKIEAIYTGKSTPESNNTLKDYVDEFNRLCLTKKINQLDKVGVKLKAIVLCTGFCFPYQEEMSLLDFIYYVSLRDELHDDDRN